MSKKIIAFTGAGGSGKSTTAEYISNANVPSPVDALRKMFYGKNARYGDLKSIKEIIKFQQMIFAAQCALENYAFEKHGNTLIPVERSSLDYAAYLLNQTQKISSPIIRGEIKRYVDFCVNHANKTYDGIVYFPSGQFVPKDKNNSSKERDEKSIAITDTYIRELLKRVKIPVLMLKSKNLQSRAKAIRKFANKIKDEKGDKICGHV